MEVGLTKLGKLAVTDQVLTFLGHLLQRLWVRDPLSWPLSVGLFTLSRLTLSHLLS